MLTMPRNPLSSWELLPDGSRDGGLVSISAPIIAEGGQDCSDAAYGLEVLTTIKYLKL